IFQILAYPLQESSITTSLERRLVLYNRKYLCRYFFCGSFFKDNVFNYCLLSNFNILLHLTFLLDLLFIRYLSNLWLLDNRRGRRRLLCWRNLHHILEVIVYSSKVDKAPLVVELPFKCGYYQQETYHQTYAEK